MRTSRGGAARPRGGPPHDEGRRPLAPGPRPVAAIQGHGAFVRVQPDRQLRAGGRAQQTDGGRCAGGDRQVVGLRQRGAFRCGGERLGRAQQLQLRSRYDAQRAVRTDVHDPRRGEDTGPARSVHLALLTGLPGPAPHQGPVRLLEDGGCVEVPPVVEPAAGACPEPQPTFAVRLQTARQTARGHRVAVPQRHHEHPLPARRREQLRALPADRLVAEHVRRHRVVAVEQHTGEPPVGQVVAVVQQDRRRAVGVARPDQCPAPPTAAEDERVAEHHDVQAGRRAGHDRCGQGLPVGEGLVVRDDRPGQADGAEAAVVAVDAGVDGGRYAVVVDHAPGPAARLVGAAWCRGERDGVVFPVGEVGAGDVAPVDVLVARGVGVVLVEEVVAVAPTEGPVRVVDPVGGRTDPKTRGVGVVLQRLTPADVMPSRRGRWPTTNTATAGIMERTTPARTTEMEPVPRLPWRETRPSGRV